MNQDLLKTYGINIVEVHEAVSKAFNQLPQKDLAELYNQSMKEFKSGTIIKGKIVHLTDKEVIVDVGYKSEGIIPRSEFTESDEIHIGDEVEMFLDGIDDETGFVLISKLKADQIKGWERILTSYKVGDTIKGKVTRAVKGGILVDIGTLAFLPASQVDVKRIDNPNVFTGKAIECKIIKIDVEKRASLSPGASSWKSRKNLISNGC